MTKKKFLSIVLAFTILFGSLSTNTVTALAAVKYVTGITISKNSLSLKQGEISHLTATVSPKKATNKKVRFKSLDTKIASVNSKGQVTANSPGETFIAVSSVDGGYMKFCKVTVAGNTTPPPAVKQPVVKRIGNSWTVDDQWAFVVDSVNTHYDCSMSSDNNVRSVVVVTFSYMNLGYTNSESGLIFSPLSFKVINSNGVQGNYYPCSHVSKPVELMEKGEVCTASIAFSFPEYNNQKNINVSVSKTPGDAFPNSNALAAVFSMEMGTSWSDSTIKPSEFDNKQKLKDYIVKYGSLDTKTNRFITRSDNNAVTQIYYKSSTDTLTFQYNENGSGTVTTLSFDMGASDMTSQTADLTATYLISSTHAYNGVFNMNFKTFKRKEKCYYLVTYTGPSGYNYAREQEFINLFSTKTLTMLDEINMLLFESCGLTVKDIGFEAYE